MPPTPAPTHNPQPEFTHAIQIKTRFSEEPEIYKQFLEILQMYQKEQRVLQDVYDQVTRLFHNAPDLIDEFKMFLPDTNNSTSPSSMVTLGAGLSQARKSAPSEPLKEGPPTKRRRNAPEKDLARSDKEREVSGHSHMHGHNMIPPHSHIHTHGATFPVMPVPVQIPMSVIPSSAPHIHSQPHPHQLTHPPSHPASMQPVLPLHSHVHQFIHPPPHSTSVQQPLLPPPEIFFDRVKRALDDRDSWEDFLKLLTMYSTDVLDEVLLLQMSAPFLGGVGSELELMFRELMGVGADGKRKEDGNLSLGTNIVSGVELPRVAGHAHGFGASGSTGATAGMGSVYLTGSKYRFGSYRRLPESVRETKLACSGRDELCRSVLNDDWVSHPTWASEDSGFVAHKKNTYEEAMHKSEEERHEYHVQLEAMAYTISLLEPIAMKIGHMSPEEKSSFKLGPSLGGRSKSIHQKIIKKVYNRENAFEVLQALQDNPVIAVPVVLERLKLVDAEWRKNKREWEKVWREVDARNFYKSLDHQGVAFKVNDKKTITGKALLAEIERIKRMQDLDRDGGEEEGSGGGGKITRSNHPYTTHSSPKPSFKKSSVQSRYQLQFPIIDFLVLQDAIKLTLYFLERNDSRQGGGSSVPQYNAIERRRIEAFLRHYVRFQFEFTEKAAEVTSMNSAGGPSVDSPDIGASVIATEAMNMTVTPSDFDLAFGPPIGKEEWEELGLYVPDLSGSTDGQPIATHNCNGSREETGIAIIHSHDETALPKSFHVRNKENNLALECEEKRDDTWIRHVKVKLPEDDSDSMSLDQQRDSDGFLSQSQYSSRHRGKNITSFFCNTNFYTLIRLLQLLYSRLLICKKLAARLAKEGSTAFVPNPIAFGLGLTDPLAYFCDPPTTSMYLRPFSKNNEVNHEAVVTEIGASGSKVGSNESNDASSPSTSNDEPSRSQNSYPKPKCNPAEHFYNHLLDLVEKVFDGDLEQSAFEEHMRFMFGTRAYIVFTLDKLCGAICKQVQAVVQDSRCHELMNMFEQQRGRDKEDINVQTIIRYRRQAEALVGSDENLFKIDWDPGKRTLQIQLLDLDDLSLNPPTPDILHRDRSENGKVANDEDKAEAPMEMVTTTPEKVNAKMTVGWKQYVESYVLIYPTEGRRIGAGRKVTLLDENCEELNDSRWVSDTRRGGMEVMVGPGTCKLYYTRGCEEAVWRVRVRKAHVVTTAGTEKNGSAVTSAKTRKKKRTDEEAEIEAIPDEWERLKERAETWKRERKRWMVDRGFLEP
ncbi:hypothetical protein Clacol_006754 [Clathrus columnatus]|uniref:Histone deacetylase interacting domain-containing protein n=1 Tax=Clathrus columnatus TaxID=1419009 RepID=A0AAV5ACZ2_9AGAM|nr:hypothetical protein Clacol_006754 [Clathrus columnatus]